LGLHPNTVLTAVFFIPAAKGAQDHSKQKGEDMKRNFFRWLVVSFGGALLAVAAYAGEADRLVVDIPYDFVVNGKTLPAGKYDVRRNSDHDLLVLSIRGVENGASAVAMTFDIRDTHESHPSVTLFRTGDQTVLTKIETGEHVFTILLPPATRTALSAAQNVYLTGTTESHK